MNYIITKEYRQLVGRAGSECRNERAEILKTRVQNAINIILKLRNGASSKGMDLHEDSGRYKLKAMLVFS